MAMRVTGMMSGMDTESIIQELVAVRQTKVDAKKKEQTKLEWKQDVWKELNTKLKNLQTKYINNMRLSTDYSKKVTKLSDESIASIITGENAVNSVQTMSVNRLAKTAYLTGSEVKYTGSSSLSALSKLSDLGFTSADGGQIRIKAGSKEVSMNVTADTTISDVLNNLKNAGLNASFDTKTKRFFVSAKESGAANDFSITSSDAAGSEALKTLGLQTGLSSSADEADWDATTKEYKLWASYYSTDKSTAIANMQSMIDTTVSSRAASYLEQYKKLAQTKADQQEKVAEINDRYKNDPLDTVESYNAQIEAKNEEIKAKHDAILKAEEEGTDTETLNQELTQLQAEADELAAKKADAQTLADYQKVEDQLAEIGEYITVESSEVDGKTTYSLKEATDKLKAEVEDEYYNRAKFASDYVNDAGNYTAGASKVSGQDALITLNGAEFTSNTNVFEINGLTITANNETEPGKTVTLTTKDDVDGIYDMIKNFIKEYNTIINEMDKLYNADSAKGYEPLTDEEKESLSESEIEKYEQKIKDSLLRRDSNLSSVSSMFKSVMSAGYTVNGKTMYLSDFGISTLGYFSAAENERNAYHIDGDEDDTSTSGNEDVLKKMISTDPDSVVSFFTSLANSFYDKMFDATKSQDGYRSYGSFYDDKKMKSDYDDYTTKIAEMEEKLADYEDKWYSKFSAMETALAKMQSNASAISSLLGGG